MHSAFCAGVRVHDTDVAMMEDEHDIALFVCSIPRAGVRQPPRRASATTGLLRLVTNVAFPRFTNVAFPRAGVRQPGYPQPSNRVRRQRLAHPTPSGQAYSSELGHVNP